MLDFLERIDTMPGLSWAFYGALVVLVILTIWRISQLPTENIANIAIHAISSLILVGLVVLPGILAITHFMAVDSPSLKQHILSDMKQDMIALRLTSLIMSYQTIKHWIKGEIFYSYPPSAPHHPTAPHKEASYRPKEIMKLAIVQYSFFVFCIFLLWYGKISDHYTLAYSTLAWLLLFTEEWSNIIEYAFFLKGLIPKPKRTKIQLLTGLSFLIGLFCIYEIKQSLIQLSMLVFFLAWIFATTYYWYILGKQGIYTED